MLSRVSYQFILQQKKIRCLRNINFSTPFQRLSDSWFKIFSKPSWTIFDKTSLWMAKKSLEEKINKTEITTLGFANKSMSQVYPSKKVDKSKWIMNSGNHTVVTSFPEAFVNTEWLTFGHGLIETIFSESETWYLGVPRGSICIEASITRMLIS